MQKIQYQKELSLRYRADLLVAGGGPAGIAVAKKNECVIPDADIRRYRKSFTGSARI